LVGCRHPPFSTRFSAKSWGVKAVITTSHWAILSRRIACRTNNMTNDRLQHTNSISDWTNFWIQLHGNRRISTSSYVLKQRPLELGKKKKREKKDKNKEKYKLKNDKVRRQKKEMKKVNTCTLTFCSGST
jgi:hypothetical protein